MGCTSSSAQNILYNSPLEGTKQKGFTPIYRYSKYIHRLEDTPEPHITSLKDIIVQNCENKYSDRDFLGKINVQKVEKDGEEVEERSLTKFKYREIFEMCVNLGTFLIRNKMIREDANEGLKLVGIFAKNRYQWMVADLACCIFGITMVPLYETLGVENLSYCLNHSEITTCFISSEKIKTILKLQDHGKLKNLIVFDQIQEQDELKLSSLNLKGVKFDDTIKKGESTEDYRNYKVTRDTIYTFSYTSGTTGPPKGAMISHGNLLGYLGSHIHIQFGVFNSDDVYLSFLPLPHIIERNAVLSIIYGGGFIGFYSGDITKIKDDAICVKPTVFIAVPRLFNRIMDAVKARFENAGGLSRCLAEGGLSSKIEQMQKDGSYQAGFYDKFVFSRVRQGFGGRIRIMFCGGAPLKTEVFEFMKAVMGCPMYNGYGQTENSGAAFFQYGEDPICGHSGAVLSSMEFKLSDIPQMNYTSQDRDDKGRSTPRGEIWLRGYNVFKGYYKDKAKTEETITKEGWLKTGDVGMLLPGSNGLKIIDRKKNIFKLQQGQYVAAEKVQAIYLRVPIVNQVFIHGNSDQNFAIAVITVKNDLLIEVAKQNGLEKSLEELYEDKKVRTLVCKQLEKGGKNEGLMSFEQAKNVYIEKQTFQDRDVLSSTLKIQRFLAKKLWGKQIAAMYQQGPLVGK